jgi:hypothetical protein
MTRLLCVAALVLSSQAALAADAVYLGRPNCRIAVFAPVPDSSVVSWDGACVDGYAQGKGMLRWMGEKWKQMNLSVTLMRGEIEGDAELKTGDYTYIGTLRQGIPHGKGYFTYKNGVQYEGDVVDGIREGKGIAVETDRSEYAGEWKDGKPHGWGEVKYAEGGSYTGQWQMGKRHGRGKLVYAGSGRSFEGEFANNLIVGPEAQEIDFLRYAFLREDRTGGPARASIPLDQPWEALTEDQKATVRSRFPALERGDEPPYPSAGPLDVLRAIGQLNQKAGAAEGTLRMAVLVGADGKAKRADVFEKPSLDTPEAEQQLVRNIASVLMLTPYKPAMCQGKPCEMVYPVLNEFIAEVVHYPKMTR